MVLYFWDLLIGKCIPSILMGAHTLGDPLESDPGTQIGLHSFVVSGSFHQLKVLVNRCHSLPCTPQRPTTVVHHSPLETLQVPVGFVCRDRGAPRDQTSPFLLPIRYKTVRFWIVSPSKGVREGDHRFRDLGTEDGSTTVYRVGMFPLPIFWINPGSL